MILTQDRVLGETMMHLVPSCSPQPPTFDASQLDFDLDLLPLADYQVPSPTSSLSPLDIPVSPTMFSSDNSKDDTRRWNVPSPGSSVSPNSPYSPAGRRERNISTQSTGCLQEVDMSNINLQESLLEFTQLQDKIKKEQDLLLDSNLSLDSGLAGPSTYPPLPSPIPQHTVQSYQLPSPAYHTVPTSGASQTFQSLSPDSSSSVKMEPLDFLEKSSLVHSSSSLSSQSKSQTVTSQTLSNTQSSYIRSSSQPSVLSPSQSHQSYPSTQPQLGNPLLKQCLQDTSFQTKYNLKPFNFGPASGFVSEQTSNKLNQQQRSDNENKEHSTPTTEENANISDVKIEPVLDLAVEQVRKDIETTCEMLSISADPKKWSKEDVKSWFLWTLQFFHIPMSMVDMDLWNMDGQMIVSLGEDDFKQRLPQGGDTMYAQFDMWRSNANYYDHPAYHVPQTCSQESQQTVPRYAPPPYPDYSSWGETQGQSITSPAGHEQGDVSSFSDIAYMLQMLDHQNNPVGDPQTHYITPKTEALDQQYSPLMGPQCNMSPPPYPASHTPTHSEAGTTDTMEEDEDDEDEEVDVSVATKSPGSRPGTNIHLWQFVKELLLQPQLYGNFIHWIDRANGIFKIVDSVKVATLWGKRKNRPAMNYDKLSRSLRQYYKKGIMKKTERSQRLVYQFCHPYHL